MKGIQRTFIIYKNYEKYNKNYRGLEIDKKHGSNAKKHNRYLGKRPNKFGKYPFGIKNSIAKT